MSPTPPADPLVALPPPQFGNAMYPPEMLAEKARVAASEAKTALIFSIIGIFCFGFIFGFLAFRKANQVIEIIDTYEVAGETRAGYGRKSNWGCRYRPVGRRTARPYRTTLRLE